MPSAVWSAGWPNTVRKVRSAAFSLRSRQASSELHDLIGNLLLHCKERIVLARRLSVLANILGKSRHHAHEGIGVGKHLVRQPQRMHLLHPFGRSRVRQRADRRLNKRAIEIQIDFRQTRRCRKAPVVFGIVSAHRGDIVERPCFAAHHPLAADQVATGRAVRFLFEDRLVESGRERIDQVDIARKLSMLLLRNAG